MSDVRAAIDIGTNSAHLVVARTRGRGGFDVLAREKELIRLGQGKGDMRELTPDAVDRGVATLRRFRQIAEVYGADLTAVATSAVREAENRQEFIRRAREEAGVDVDVISGVEEARLIRLGVLQAVPVYDVAHLLVDIGGGSTELVVGLKEEVWIARSLKLGAIRLTSRFFPDGVVEPAQVEECRRYVDSFLATAAHEVRPYRFEVAVGSSGTIANVAEIVERSRGRTPERWVNNVEFSREDLDMVVERVLALRTAEERKDIDGLDANRADIFPGAVLLLERIFERLGLEAMVVSEFALREGVLLDRLEAGHGEGLHHLNDIRRDSVLRLLEGFHEDREHVEHVTDLALEIFDQLRPLHGFGSHERDLLESAGLLHNIGMFIAHSAHHRHSYYVIRNSDQLLGFTEQEVEVIAQVARYHRKSAPKPRRHREFANLSQADRNRVRVLAGILRIALALDRTRDDVVVDVVADVGRSIRLRCVVRPGADASLELYTAAQRAALLEQALGKDVEVELTEEPETP